MMADPGPNGGARPVPDPTILTTEQLLRAIAAERDFVNGQLDVLRERLAGIDVATELRVGTGTAVTAATDEKIGHLSSLVDERFASIATQFKERDTRSERESRDNKVAVDAAFAAQKEAAAKQDEGNQKSIDKSEKATNESINKLGDVVKASNEALTDKIEDLRTRLSELASQVNGSIQSHAGGQEQKAGVYAAAGFVISLIFVAIAIAGIAIAR
jgi:DNA anti-recombination protein RmuC